MRRLPRHKAGSGRPTGRTTWAGHARQGTGDKFRNRTFTVVPGACRREGRHVSGAHAVVLWTASSFQRSTVVPMKTLGSRDNQLRMFVAVAKANSLREAAEILVVTQPALSKQIRALELALGTKLFLRHGRGMQLTPDGHALFLKVEPLLNSLDATFSQSGHQSQQGGT